MHVNVLSFTINYLIVEKMLTWIVSLVPPNTDPSLGVSDVTRG